MICIAEEASGISIARDFLSHSLFGHLIVIHSFDRSAHPTTEYVPTVYSLRPTWLISRLLRVVLVAAS